MATRETRARMNVEVNYTIGRNELNSIQKELQNIVKLSESIGKDNEMESTFKESAAAAKELSNVLNSSWDNSLNQLNLTKFDKSVKDSFGSVEGLKESLAKSGPYGEAAFNQLANGVLRANVQLSKGNTILDKMGTNLKRTLGWAISSSVINSLTGSLQSAYGYVKALDSSLNDIQIVTDKSADDMERFAVQANKAAKALSAGTKDYTNASLIYYQQGLSDSEVAARTETTLKAANVTGQSTNEVSEELTAVWNGYKVTAQETEKYVDKMAAVAATTASDLEELSVGMSKVASAANLMGVDVDQLNAILATTISVTRQAPESVGTALTFRA